VELGFEPDTTCPVTCKKILKDLFGKLQPTPFLLEGCQCGYPTPVVEGEIKIGTLAVVEVLA
jgi:hypothetical protein